VRASVVASAVAPNPLPFCLSECIIRRFVSVMVNFNDPAVVVKDILALRELYLVINGVYLWEFFTNLGYEFSIIRGHRRYRGTIWIYSISRWSALVSIILNFMYLTTTTPINCQLWITFQAGTGYLSLIAASLLIVIRIVAIWNKDKIAAAIASGVWLLNVAATIEGVARLRSKWDVFLAQCIVTNSESNRLNLIVFLITDIVLLLIVLIGLLRMRHHGDSTFGIRRLLWKQGVLWLLLATVAEVPGGVFIILNLNAPLNLISLLPSVVMMTISATRMYRSLTDFDNKYITSNNPGLPNGDREASVKWNIAMPVDKIKATVNSTTEQFQFQVSGPPGMSHPARHDPCMSADEQPSEKPYGCEPRQEPGEVV